MKRYAFILLLIVTFAISGCSYQVLSFFFTGVPNPDEATAVASEVYSESTEQQVAYKSWRNQHSFTHGPWVNNQCGSCHANMGTTVKAAATTSNLRQVCRQCHAEEQFTATTSYWQHGPAINGQCTTCHDPHQSSRQFLLRGESTSSLCGGCHETSELPTSHNMSVTEDCARCHNPHGSKRRWLLREGISS